MTSPCLTRRDFLQGVSAVAVLAIVPSAGAVPWPSAELAAAGRLIGYGEHRYVDPYWYYRDEEAPAWRRDGTMAEHLERNKRAALYPRWIL